MAAGGVSSALHYWLVDHPAIRGFTWAPEQTFGSSPLFLAATVLTYLAVTWLLVLLRLPPLPAAVLKPVTVIHNLGLNALSLAMAAGCFLSALSQAPNGSWVICFPAGETPAEGPTFFWAYVFYLSKVLELVDTLLIVLSGSIQRLTFLHVYHHATVLVMCYVWLQTAQSLFPVALVTNASVHVLMYGYYFLCGIGFRPPWKKAVTNCQIVQFMFSFAVSGLMLRQHFTGPGCSGICGWCFNAVFNASLLALFIDFHLKSYARRKNNEKNEKQG